MSLLSNLTHEKYSFHKRLHLHGDAALQFELQLDHVHLLAGAELGQLCRPGLHLIYGHVHWLKLHVLLSDHLYALLHIWEGVGS